MLPESVQTISEPMNKNCLYKVKTEYVYKNNL